MLVDAVWAESHGPRVGDTIDRRILGNDGVRALEATSEVGEVERLVGDPAFGTPAPGFRSPAEIFGGPRVGYESGGNPRRSAPGAPGRKKSAPKKRSPR